VIIDKINVRDGFFEEPAQKEAKWNLRERTSFHILLRRYAADGQPLYDASENIVITQRYTTENKWWVKAEPNK